MRNKSGEQRAKSLEFSKTRFGLISLVVWWLCGYAALEAAPPGFESITPAGGQVGTRVEVVVAGKGLEKGQPVAWCSHPGVVLLAGQRPKQFHATIAKDAKPGPCLVRFYTSEGASPPRLFVVGDLAETAEKEPNDTFSEVRKIEPQTSNTVINGVLDRAGDIDTHAFRVKKGKKLRLELQGYSIGSPMDPAMRLLDSRGVEIASAHDSHNLDPLLHHTPAADGVLFAQVMAFAHPPAADVSLKGSANHVYRLVLRESPAGTAPGPEPAALALPASLRGVLEKPHHEDVFSLQVKKGDDLAFRLSSAHFDPVLRVEAKDGKVLSQADDDAAGGNDSVLRWKATADAEVRVVVSDRFHGGGADFSYELTAVPFESSLTATLEKDAVVLTAGSSVEVKWSVKVNGAFTGKLTAKAVELPAGVSAESVEISAKGGDAKIVLKAAADAPAEQTPIRIEISDGKAVFPAQYVVPFTEPRGELLITKDAQMWLTVVEKKK